MIFNQKKELIIKQPTDCLLVPFFKETNLKNHLSQLYIDDCSIDIMGKKAIEVGQLTILLPVVGGSISITLMYLGSEVDFTLNALTELFQCFGKQVMEDYHILLEGLHFSSYTVQEVTKTLIKAMFLGAYTFSYPRLAEVKHSSLFALREEIKNEKYSRVFTLVCSTNLQDGIGKAIDYGECINYARTLGDIPNNYLHVKEFTEYVCDFAKEYNLPCEVLKEEDLQKLHMGGIIGVHAGSCEEANLVTVYYEGSCEESIIALIGKGVMFDSGGYHLKSMVGMDGMKYDMCGAANVLSVLEIAVRQQSKTNILVVIPVVENMISSSACKMGDVLTTLSGKTVEVYNTDAEGRLILCDAITYAINMGANKIIDIGTLTNSCQKALGDDISGIFSNNDEFYESFIKKTYEQCEKVWRLPLDDSYRKLLYRSNTADLINYAPGSGGGASFAACFLEAFIENDIPWIHLDIVGPAVNRHETKRQSIGATGVLIASIAALLE